MQWIPGLEPVHIRDYSEIVGKENMQFLFKAHQNKGVWVIEGIRISVFCVNSQIKINIVFC